jgi:CPA1 family monovalent cation:H+ antiporter
MVLVLGLPYAYEGRELLVHLVFGVVSASLFLQGLTVGPLLARLGLTPQKSEAAQRIERHRARQIASGHALHTVHELAREGVLGEPAAHRIERWYAARHEAAAADLADALGEDGSVLEQEIAAGLLEVLDKERASLREAMHAGVVGEKAAADLIEELDERASALREALHHGHDIRETIDTVLSER